ncbi:MAG: hypothetical protein CME07_04365 [Gemmatimonadetes bacterium]|nr:hypothetical protein [Gemmatimonadota bacterium]
MLNHRKFRFTDLLRILPLVALLLAGSSVPALATTIPATSWGCIKACYHDNAPKECINRYCSKQGGGNALLMDHSEVPVPESDGVLFGAALGEAYLAEAVGARGSVVGSEVIVGEDLGLGGATGAFWSIRAEAGFIREGRFSRFPAGDVAVAASPPAATGMESASWGRAKARYR